jgi:CBS domain-containing protein
MPQRLIRRIIEQRTVLTARADTTVHAAARQMHERGVGSVLVVTGGHLVGIFTERDALDRVLAAGRNAKTTRLSEVMTPNPQAVHPDQPFGYALLMMYENGYRHVPVVENGRPVGVVSARDVLGPELKEFELEIERRKRIGEILG